MHTHQAFNAICRRSFSAATPRWDMQLAYQRFTHWQLNKGPPIVMMHGLFGSRRNNRGICKTLVRELQRSIYSIDLRNHGSSPHSPRHDYISMAEDVEAFIRKHGLEQPVLIGHSMGAKVAMTVALRKQVPISALIPVDNAPIDATLKTDFSKFMQGMRAVEDAKVDKQSDADAILEKHVGSLPIRQFLLTNLTRSYESKSLKFSIPLTFLANALDHMGDFPFKDPDQARYEGPTLFVRGTQSHYIADEALPVLGRFFPRFELLDIESGHWVISEKPQEFRSGVVDFLQRNEAA